MTLSRNTKKPKKQSLIVYDLEWVPETYKLRLAGVYDGLRYQSFASVRGLLNFLLQPKHEKCLFLAHAGGLADMHFLLEQLQQHKAIHVTAAFSGSSAIVVKVTWQGRTYTFLDSYWLLRDKLAHLAPYTGVKKDRGAYKCDSYPACGHVGRACMSAPECGCDEGPEPLCMFTAPIHILTDYNERDCLILWRALDLFQDMLIDEMGTEMRSTIASTALGLFRTKYLETNITTDPARNDRLRASYDASRVEVIRPRLLTEGRYYDVNSSFPFAMTFPCPGEYLGQSRTLPDNDSVLYFADVTVSVPDMFLPPLPAKGKDGRTFFPVGTWRRLYAKPDLELLQKTGGRIEAVHEVTLFHPFGDLAHYALDLYARRAKAKAEGKSFLALLIKYLLNSCYGKFGEHREKQQLVLHPYTEGCPHNGAHDELVNGCAVASCVEPLFPGCILVTEERQIAHEHVAIASHITSIARRTLYETILAPCGEDIYYTDTDSGVTTRELPEGKKLGELKLEKIVSPGIASDGSPTPAGRFIQPKLYELGGEIKSKGFSRLTRVQFEDLIEGREVEVERMFRVKETARELRGFGAHGKKFGKKIHVGASRPKRQSDGENMTRPWTFKEINERWRP